MANSVMINQAASVAGLGTTSYTVTAADAGFITVNVQSTIPHDPGSQLNSAQVSPQASALQIVINQNGTPKVTVGGSAQNPTPNQPSMGAVAKLQCVAGDVITVVLSSANSADANPNAVKSTINLYQGE